MSKPQEGLETDHLLPKSPASSIKEMDITSTSESNSVNKRRTLLVTLCILTTEMCERLTYYSIVCNLVLYCTSVLGLSQSDATTLNQVFSGFVYIIPVPGGFLADSYLGRYNTIFVFCMVYIIGTILLPASAVVYSDWGWGTISTTDRLIIFLVGLLFVALGTGGIKANVGPFGAEQVQALGQEAVQSFFNWFYWVINMGALIAYIAVAYIQQEISFAWGYFVPMVSMILAVIIFVSGRLKYKKTKPQGSILTVAYGIVKQGACKPNPPPNPDLPEGSEKKILASSKKSFGGSYSDHLVDGVYSVIKVLPFCALVIMYWALYSQMSNTFFAQGERMNVDLGGGVNIPVAALNCFNTISIIVLIPLVDKLLYPCFVRMGCPLTYLKRMGIGMVLAAIALAVAGVVEIYRKIEMNEPGGTIYQELGGQNFTASKMSVLVQIPQFTLIGASEIFTSITSLEFAYNQAPVAMQGLLTGLFLAASGVGNWVSSAILAIVQAATVNDPWWGDEINDCHMEYLMFLLAGLMVLNTIIFAIVAHFYTYQDPSRFEVTITVAPREADPEGLGSKTNQDYQNGDGKQRSGTDASQGEGDGTTAEPGAVTSEVNDDDQAPLQLTSPL